MLWELKNVIFINRLIYGVVSNRVVIVYNWSKEKYLVNRYIGILLVGKCYSDNFVKFF